MYLDHRVTVKIARILNMIDLSALLLDNSGSVILPEGDPRVLNLPEAIRTNPTMPLVYGGFTLIGTSEDQPVFICLTGDSEDVKKCAVLCAELINMMLREDMSQTNREQSLRMMLRGEVETSGARHSHAGEPLCAVLLLPGSGGGGGAADDERRPGFRGGHAH